MKGFTIYTDPLEDSEVGPLVQGDVMWSLTGRIRHFMHDLGHHHSLRAHRISDSLVWETITFPQFKGPIYSKRNVAVVI